MVAVGVRASRGLLPKRLRPQVSRAPVSWQPWQSCGPSQLRHDWFHNPTEHHPEGRARSLHTGLLGAEAPRPQRAVQVLAGTVLWRLWCPVFQGSSREGLLGCGSGQAPWATCWMQQRGRGEEQLEAVLLPWQPEPDPSGSGKS